MPKYIIESDMGFCGTEETFIVQAESEDEAEQLVLETLMQNVTVTCACEAEEEDEEAGYTEL